MLDMDCYDVVIVGGGPAGMTAALYALRANKRVCVIERSNFGGQITHSPKVENYPGTMEMSGNDFANQLTDQILANGAEVMIGTVAGIRDEGTCKTVVTEEGEEFVGRTVILATGAKHRRLGLPGETELLGNGVYFCAVCDGAQMRGKTVAVVGGGNSGAQEAMLLSDLARRVIIVQDLPCLTGEMKLQDSLRGKDNVSIVCNSLVQAYVTEDGGMKALKIKNQESGEISELACDAVFLAIGLAPENQIFSHMAKLNAYGYLDSGEDCLTITPGVFAAGDCRSKKIRQLTTAVGDGAVAALAACSYLDS